MPSISNLVQQKTSSTGTGNLALTAAHGRQGFYGAFGSGGADAFFYFVTHAAAQEWEVGTGHLADAATLVRDTVIASSNAGAKVNFSAGEKDVVNDVPASYQAKVLTLAAVANSGSYNDLSAAPGVTPGQAKKLVLLGDSIMRMNHDGASGTRNCYWGPRGALAWAQVRLGFPFYCPAGYSENNATQTLGFNAGKGGDTAAGMVARLSTDVLALSPDYVYLMAGTNDIAGGDTYANISANLATIIDACIAHGATVIVETIPARTDAVGANDWLSTAQRKLHQRVNNFLRGKADTTRGMILVDAAARLVDQSSANGNVIAAYSADGLHSSVLGGFWRGDALVEALQHKVPDPRTGFFSPYDLYDSSANPQGNWLANGQMSGTSGTAGTGASGSVASSWTAERASGTTITIAASKMTKTQGANGLFAQKLVITSPGTGSGMEQVKFRPTTSTFSSGISTGDWFEMECRISVDAVSGAVGAIEGIYLNLEDLTSVSSNTTRARCFANQFSAAGAFPDVAWSGVLKTPPLQLRGTDGLAPSFRVELDATKNMAVAVTVHGFRVRKLAAAPFAYPA